MTASFPHDMVKDGRSMPNVECPQCLERTGVYIGIAKRRNIYQCSGVIAVGGVWRDCATIFYGSPFTPSYRLPVRKDA